MTKIAVAAALVALVACAHGRSREAAPTIADADLGRLAPEQMGAIERERQAVATARDELARARLRQQETQREVGLAKADGTAANAEAQRAAAEANVANQSREAAALQRAQQLQQTAALRKQAADAHLDWANKLAETRAAQVSVAEQQVALAQAQLELAKLRSLQASSIPAASKYDPNKFEERVRQARQAYDEAFTKARDAETRAMVAQRRYEDVSRQLQAFTGGRSG